MLEIGLGTCKEATGSNYWKSASKQRLCFFHKTSFSSFLSFLLDGRTNKCENFAKSRIRAADL